MLTHKIKKSVQQLFFKPGSIQKIVRGPLKGSQYRVDEFTGWSHLLGRWEPAATRFYVRTLAPGHVVYDLGANTGMHTLLFSKLVGNRGKVYAFEPLSENIERIQDVIGLNQLGNVTVVGKAVSDHSGQGSFDTGPNNFQGMLSDNPQMVGKRVTVQLTTLDEFIASGAPGPNFLKMDIEGGEGSALEGFEKQIDIFQPIMAIELHTPEQDLKVGKFLKRKNYQVFRLGMNYPLQEIQKLDSSWPDPEGIWGTIIACPLR